jgi:hypothetical protein
LSLGETEPSGKLCAPERGSCDLETNHRPGPLGHALSEICDTALVFDDTGCRPNRLPGTGNERQGNGVLVRKHLVNCAVQDRDGQAVEMRRDSDDDVGAGESLVRGEPPARSQQLGGEVIEDFATWRSTSAASSGAG